MSFKRLLMAAWKKLPIPFFLRKWYTYLTNSNYLVGVDAVITNDAGEVLIFHHTYRKTPWGIPGGFLGDEEPAEGLVREVREEAGMEIEITGIADVRRVVNVYGVKFIEMTYFARYAGGEFRKSAEVDDYMFVSPGQWPVGFRLDQQRMIAKYIEDGKL